MGYELNLKKSISTDIEYVSRQYEYLMDAESQKKTGSFYTDRSIIKYMLGLTLEVGAVVSNPYIRILDPSCGCGYFIIEVYDVLKKIYTDHLNDINTLHPELELTCEGIHEHILKHNIFGADIDAGAVKLAVLGLMGKKPGSTVCPNIICCDSLMDLKEIFLEKVDFWRPGFDIIIGNPPYIGHKKLSGSYRKTLNGIYGDIFKDKADLSFCFIKSSLDRLHDGGKLCFITSRYFLESPNGRALREHINRNAMIINIVDFYGIRIMKGISVDPMIIFLKKVREHYNNEVKVLKAKGQLKSLDGENIFREIENDKYFDSFNVPQHSLKDEGWSLCRPSVLSIVDKIEKRSKLRLSDICFSFQGVITGCDRAFVMDEEDVGKYNIERDIIRPWIKNSGVCKYKVQKGNRYIIYSDLIDDEAKYENALSFIARYKERLMGRRECRTGARKWYQLQWGRDRLLFEGRKIIFPYKSSSNRFAVDEGNYCSADVYGMHIKNEKADMSYEFLLGILNSRLYEFYFKSFGKKLGDNLYDYYPNTVMRLMVPERDKFIEDTVKKIIETGDEGTAQCMKEIDMRIYDIFGLSDDDINIVEGRV